MALLIRSGDGLLRRTRNLCLSSLLKAVRDSRRGTNLWEREHAMAATKSLRQTHSALICQYSGRETIVTSFMSREIQTNQSRTIRRFAPIPKCQHIEVGATISNLGTHATAEVSQ